MDYSKIITIEPDKRSGKPCIRGLRMTVTDVLEYLAGGMTPEEIVDKFPDLTLEDIRACLAFAADRECRLAAPLVISIADTHELTQKRHELTQKALDAIPSYRQPPRTVEEIAATIAKEFGVSQELASGITLATIAFLDTFGVIEWEKSVCQINDQISTYFRNSLSWYFENHQQLLSNWGREGVARDIKIDNLLELAPYFLKVMEERRLELSKEHRLEAGYSRYQAVALTLVKTIEDGKPCFLHQWDTQAEQFQIIGGKQRPGERPIETAKREFTEETTQHNLRYGTEFTLNLLCPNPIEMWRISPTYGALTKYEFWVFSAELKLAVLPLGPLDRWISLDEMKSGATLDGRPISDPKLYRSLEVNIPGVLEGLPLSIPPSPKQNSLKTVWDNTVMQPGFAGFKIDLKKLLQDWWSNRKRGKLK
ncbi:MAG: DUF433 domain-containing protein [Acidobacteria bacterium]|nr:DUF433 domain-containing protein [Acidobacteriota bacterium]